MAGRRRVFGAGRLSPRPDLCCRPGGADGTGNPGVAGRAGNDDPAALPHRPAGAIRLVCRAGRVQRVSRPRLAGTGADTRSVRRVSGLHQPARHPKWQRPLGGARLSRTRRHGRHRENSDARPRHPRRPVHRRRAPRPPRLLRRRRQRPRPPPTADAPEDRPPEGAAAGAIRMARRRHGTPRHPDRRADVQSPP